jgi:hypothetical protein
MAGNVEEFLEPYSPEVRDIALKVRESIRVIAPHLKEKVYGGWKTVGYSFSGGMKDAVFAGHFARRSWGFA